MASYGFICRYRSDTHRRRDGRLDVVASTRRQSTFVQLTLIFLITKRSAGIQNPSYRRHLHIPWRQLDHDEFRAAVAVSRLCRPGDWPAGIDEPAALYTGEIRARPRYRYMHLRLSVDQAIHGLILNAALQNAPHVVTSVRLLRRSPLSKVICLLD